MAPRQEEAIHPVFDFNNQYRELIFMHLRIRRQQVQLAIQLREKKIEYERVLEEISMHGDHPTRMTKFLDLRRDVAIIRRRQNEYENMQRPVRRELNRLLLSVELNDPTYFTNNED